MSVKIAFIVSNLDEDGGQTVVSTLMKNLDKSKYMAKLFVLSSEVDNKLTQMLYAEKIEIKFVRMKYDLNYIRIFEIQFWLNRELKAFNPDVVHVHLDTIYSWIWACIHKKRIIFTVHSEAERIYNRMSGKLFKVLQKYNLIRVIGVAECVSKQFMEVFGAEFAETIYNPVDIEHFSGKTCTNATDEVTFINVARFFPVKNHKVLIDAFDMLCKHDKNVKLILVGDGQELNNIREYVWVKGLKNHVEFKGYIKDVAPLLKEADVYVMSSVSEAFPVSVIEAMAAGLPIVATRVGGLPEQIQDNGILVEPGNTSKLYRAMCELDENVEKRVQMGELSRQKSMRYSVNKILLEYERIYNEEAGQ